MVLASSQKIQRVCIQGLGFVGAAMAVAVASARSSDGNPLYHVTGVDRNTPEGCARVEAISHCKFPFPAADTSLHEKLSVAYDIGNLDATTDESVYTSADVVIIDVALDISFRDQEPQFQMAGLEEAVRSVAQRIPEGALLLVETTVPPGACQKVVLPILKGELRRRGLDDQSVHLAHSFERVMPGNMYLDSITHFWRVYSGATIEAADRCEAFLSSIVDIQNYPLTRLSSMTASETAKVMENTYRAVNIALIDEWTKYAELVGIDLFEIIDSIRVRPTHSNMRYPGLGVGGYCLTKDPAFAPAAVRKFFEIDDLDFPFSRLALKVNQEMPTHTVGRLEGLLDDGFKDRSVLVLGASYRQDVGDTRNSPVEVLVRTMEIRGAKVLIFDPFVDHWPEIDRTLPTTCPEANGFDAVVFATAHHEFAMMDLVKWLGRNRPVVLDAVNVVTSDQRERCLKIGIPVESVGRGKGL